MQSSTDTYQSASTSAGSIKASVNVSNYGACVPSVEIQPTHPSDWNGLIPGSVDASRVTVAAWLHSNDNSQVVSRLAKC